jgi:chromosome segregation ATPase
MGELPKPPGEITKSPLQQHPQLDHIYSLIQNISETIKNTLIGHNATHAHSDAAIESIHKRLDELDEAFSQMTNKDLVGLFHTEIAKIRDGLDVKLGYHENAVRDYRRDLDAALRGIQSFREKVIHTEAAVETLRTEHNLLKIEAASAKSTIETEIKPILQTVKLYKRHAVKMAVGTILVIKFIVWLLSSDAVTRLIQKIISP